MITTMEYTVGIIGKIDIENVKFKMDLERTDKE